MHLLGAFIDFRFFLMVYAYKVCEYRSDRVSLLGLLSLLGAFIDFRFFLMVYVWGCA